MILFKIKKQTDTTIFSYKLHKVFKEAPFNSSIVAIVLYVHFIRLYRFIEKNSDYKLAPFCIENNKQYHNPCMVNNYAR